ncbi:phosphatidylglycerophosphate synthase [Microthyrium microscopicum]|uniref:CDP-diacylglycerol--glycerol-3-phosphate 3-phosphatidyltransferase n=1 Tax=Microthyrium microscopicum TaxID=703497 RepID=A0A6A6U9X3_9PEZI|nr:phosphatidylglycerophosphate synthase [Microthyrium microscopicum]
MFCVKPRLRPCTRWKIPRARGYRRFGSFGSQSASSSSSSQGQTGWSALGGLISELDHLSPRFEVKPNQIEIIRGPVEFYEVLKAKISTAKRRIYLSTLYIGKTEHELIETIIKALRSNSELKLSILTDALRGTRETPNPSCASLLAPLIAEFGSDRVEIRMFHTPNLTGLRKAAVPKRINEGWGLQHMKLYGIDDEVILSGANLSEDYFTNRQDRYHIFKSSAITDYFSNIHGAICSLSFNILPTKDDQQYSMTWPSTNPAPSPLESPREFRKASTTLLSPLLNPKSTPSPLAASSTAIYPLLQFTPLLTPDSSTELPALTAILQSLATSQLAGASWTFTAGYFNMTPPIRRLLLATNPSHGTVIAASPFANGFYQSRGVSGMLPDAYTLLSARFVAAVRRANLASRITLKEWRRGTVNAPGGWSYHAKGLWVTLAGEDAPSVSLVGSSNYTRRSYELDLEANVLVVTRDAALMRKLAAEEAWLQEDAKAVGSEEFERPERAVGIKVRLAMWLVRVLGGAL